MSLNWDWGDKLGEVINDNGRVDDIYCGNALFIIVHTDEQKFYHLVDFAADEKHFENCLGLHAKQGYSDTNLYNDRGYTKIRLNTAYKRTAKIASLFAKGKTNITIEFYNEPNAFSDYK